MPRFVRLRVDLLTPRGQTLDLAADAPAAAALYAPSGELVIPPEALSFDDGGFSYAPSRARSYRQAHFWPGDSAHRRVFFVPDRFTVRAPEGTYKLYASNGPEYVPVSDSIAVHAGTSASHRVTLRRWSGDGHVHYTRANADADRRLMLWTRAEDVHVANVLRMGDARLTRLRQARPRRLRRLCDRSRPGRPAQQRDWPCYDLVFDAVHAMGGLAGYAHVYQPPAFRRNMGVAFEDFRVIVQGREGPAGAGRRAHPPAPGARTARRSP